MIRLTVPCIEPDDFRGVREVLESGYLVQGKRVRRFEELLAQATGTSHAIAVSNCTMALLLALQALELEPGDRVAVAAYSWPATANVILLAGLTPVFVDIDPRTFNLDPADLIRRVRSGGTVRAVLPVHTFGGSADMRSICAVARELGAAVIEDAACALGTLQDGRPAGSWGQMGCFSFHPRKAITTGEGGAVVTNDAALARRLRILQNHGEEPGLLPKDFVAPGYNTRLTELQGALGVSQMAKLDRLIMARRRRASFYDYLLRGSSVLAPARLARSRHVYQSYVTLLPPTAGSHRAEIIQELRSQGIETQIGTYHMPLLTCFRERLGCSPGDFPVTDDVDRRTLTLPLHERLTGRDQEFVVSRLLRVVERYV